MTAADPLVCVVAAVVRHRSGGDATTIGVRPLGHGDQLVIGAGGQPGVVPWPPGPVLPLLAAGAVRIGLLEYAARVRVAAVPGARITVCGNGHDVTERALTEAGALVASEGRALVVDVRVALPSGAAESVTVVLTGREPD